MRPAWLRIAGRTFAADPSGALIWPEQALVVVADLHLEHGSSLARRGLLLPPYDTRSTLARLAEVLARWAPRRVISLGDGFHDASASGRLSGDDRARVRELTLAHDWLWLAGNHDPMPPDGLGGRSEAAVRIDGITFRHLPEAAAADGEIAGHLHPKARLTLRGRQLSRPCFVGDRKRLILPAFGSYTGGLDVRAPAIARLFKEGFAVRVLGGRGVYLIADTQTEG